MNIVDAILIVLLMIGTLDGIRKGALKTLVELVGSILVIFLSWVLKGSLANLLINKLPVIGNNPVISVVVYNIIAFVLLLIVFSLIYKALLGLSSVIEKIFDATIVLGIVSKIVGAVLGFVRTYLILFFALFMISTFNFKIFNESKVNEYMLDKTPIVAPMIEDLWQTIKDAYSNSNVEETIKAMFEKNIINEENMDLLIDKYNESRK